MEYIIKKILPDLEGEVIVNEHTYKIPFVIPGDLVEFQIKRHGKKKKLIPLRIQRTTNNLDYLEEPLCKYFSQCGGCKAQHLKYDYQWNLKTHELKEQYEKQYDIQSILIKNKNIYHYRNRMDFVVNETLVGLRKPYFYNHLVDIDYCYIQKKEANLILQEFRKLLYQFPEIGFNRKTKKGYIKYITIRTGKTIFIILTINETEIKNGIVYNSYLEFINEFIKKIINLEEQLNLKISLKECYVNEYSEVSNVSNGKILYGKPYMLVEFGSLDFYLSPDAFFQPNPEIIQNMIQHGINILLNDQDFNQNQYQLVDLYCGVGTLSLYILNEIHRFIHSISGIEFISSAIEKAKMNFEYYFKNKQIQIPYDFFVEDLNQSINIPLKEHSILILDPPRSGMHTEVLKWILIHHQKIDYILYLSCSPEKQYDDIKKLSNYYKILSITFGDPFPHTPHWESLIILKHI